MPDGRAVDHLENKGPSAGRGQVPRCSNRTEPEATTHAVPRRRRRFDLKSVHHARPRASDLFVAVCVGGLKVVVRARRMPAAWPPPSSFLDRFWRFFSSRSPRFALTRRSAARHYSPISLNAESARSSPLPATVVCRSHAELFHRAGRQRSGIELRLL